MKYRYLFSALFAGMILAGTSVHAQLVDDDAFLQGHWLEACIAPNGSWGQTVTAPAGYHTHPGGNTDYTDSVTHTSVSNGMDFNYDYMRDGWHVGTTDTTFTSTGPVPWWGPYFMPGTPFNGWAMQVNGIMSMAFYTDAGDIYTGGGYDNRLGGTLCGSVRGYSNTGGVMKGVWTGTAGVAGALQITQTNELDTDASWLVVTTKFVNTSGSTMPGLYYFVSGDPDNDETDSDGYFPTNNYIAYQGDYFNRHEVIAHPGNGIHTKCISGLATKDCRAKAMIYASWPPSTVAGNDLDLMWSGTATELGAAEYTLGSYTAAQDIAYALVYNLGDLAAGDSAILSFAWLFQDTSDIDSAFPPPEIVTNGVAYDSLDTVIGCDLTGTSFMANIIHGADRDWSWSQWTWSPSLGLSATTGTNVTINTLALSGPTIYTVIGTDTSAGTMMSCQTKVFYLYVTPCFHAVNDGPKCMNDTVTLIARGDSLGATYYWYGPGGYSATGQFAYIYPTMTIADTGRYYVIKTAGGISDTVSTDVQLLNIPIVNVTSNGPICSSNTLAISATPDSIGETFNWTGPNGFTSALQYPTIANVTTTATGRYKVITQLGTCFDSGFINITVDSTPALPVFNSNSPVCSQRSIPLMLDGTDATLGVNYSWIGPNGFLSTSQNNSLTTLTTDMTGIYTLTVSITYDGLLCPNSVTKNIYIDSTPIPPTLTTNAPVCSGTILTFTATDTPGATFDWYGPDGFMSGLYDPSITTVTTNSTGIYFASATVAFTVGGSISCTSDTATVAAVVDSTPVGAIITSNSSGTPSICQGDTLTMFASDTTEPVQFIWVGPNSFNSTQENPIVYNVTPAATGDYTVTVIYNDSFRCPTATVMSVSITPTPPLTVTSNGPVCTGNADTLFLMANSAPGATFNWVGPYTFSSLLQNPFRDPVIMEYAGVYIVKAYLNGCVSSTTYDTVEVRQTPAAPWVKWVNYCQNFDAPYMQANGDSILWYPTSSSLVGTLTAPLPTTNNVGNYWYYVTQTLMGCTSAVDSIQVSIYPKPTVGINNDTVVCPHDSVVLTAVDTDPITYYHWSPWLYLNDTSTASVTANVETNMIYTVVATNQYNCTDTATVKVNVVPAAVISLGNDGTVYPGQSFQINTQTNCTVFSWFPPMGLSDPSSGNPLASPVVTTKYIVTAETSWGCFTTDSINVLVDDNSSVSVPNVFTPGTGVNNLFKIVLQGQATLKSFTVFDRWGVKLFETNDINVGWDGEFNGTVQPQGVYIYQVNAVLSNGDVINKSGNVTLLR